MAKIFRKTKRIEEICSRLIKAANDNGGPDNITAVVGRAGLSGGKPGRSFSGTILMKPPAPNKG
jgi:serine/threonine protein phosphatase PrpC